MPQPATPSEHAIRVFVSSTFLDMQPEREELVKRVFPRLRRLCEERGVTWGEVDLRWGVTDEQKAEGRVLPICLEEIQRCRPYFIGLLGRRYGWVPDELPEELVAQQPWLAEHLRRSVTELEILHGVLNRPDMACHAFFYFRDPACPDGLPPEEEAKAEKLHALKDRIRRSGLPVRENYRDPKNLGELVYEDLRAVIDSRFPARALDPLDREAADHEAFAHSRARVYIGRQEYFDRLDNHTAGEGEPLVVLGESGSGKSALLANWVWRYREQHPGQMVLLHFIGASAQSADWAAMLRRILGEFRRGLGLQLEIPDAPDALRKAFTNALHMAAARGRVVLVLDALNQLEDRDGAPDLVWLPPLIPANVRLLVSTLPGRPLEDLTKRGWPVLQVEPLAPAERKQLIREYLAQYTKALSETRLERIASAAQTSNPLYLRALLDELRVFGVYERLDERIGHYLAAGSVPELYRRILARWEEDYEGDRRGLVRDGMTALWAARRGLSEAELLVLLGAGDQPLPQAYWSPLYLAAEQALVSRSGLIGFAHDYLREAVAQSWLENAEARQAAHRRLGECFESRPAGHRRIEELPWQWMEAGEWDRLAHFLGEPDSFGAAWLRDQYSVKQYWTRLEAMSNWRMTQVYGTLQDVPGEADDQDHILRAARLLADTGHLSEAYALGTHLVDYYRQAADLDSLQEAVGHQASILRTWGRLEEALAMMKEQERLCRELGNQEGLSVSLVNQAVILRTWGRLEESLALIQEQERLCHELGNQNGLEAALGNHALVLQDWGRLEEALNLMKEQERLCHELGNQHGLAMSLANQALVLWTWGRLKEALALMREEERLCRELGDKHGLHLSLGGQAVVFRDWGRLEEALALHQEQERLCRELGDQYGLLHSLGGQAAVLRDWGRPEEALTLHKQEERLCRELGDKSELSVSLGGQALVLRDWGRPEEALALYQEQEALCRELGNKRILSASLGNQAVILRDWGRPEEALALHKEEERLCRELGNKYGLSMSLGNQAVVLLGWGRLEEALELMKEQERLCRELGNKYGLAMSLGNEALILEAWGRLEESVELMKEQERLCRELGNDYGLQCSLGNQAAILLARSRREEAAALLKEQEDLCRRLAHKDGLRTSLGNQAVILRAQGQREKAMELHKEEERLCRETGNKDGLRVSLGNQAAILRDWGRQEEAMALHKEEEHLCREVGSKDGLRLSLSNQALISRDWGRREEALALLQEAERLCRELGDKNGFQSALAVQTVILRELDRPGQALALHKANEDQCRETGDREGLAGSLASQAVLLSEEMHRPAEALPLAEEAYRLASDHGLAVAEEVRSILESVRSKLA